MPYNDPDDDEYDEIIDIDDSNEWLMTMQIIS